MQKDTLQSENSVFVRSHAELYAWLVKNHIRKESVWLVYFKSSLKKSDLTYSTIVDALLAFGWIDSLPRKVDNERTSLRISPRNPKSNWSKINKEKVAVLTQKKRMQPSGLKAVALAKRTGTWTALADVDALLLPRDLHSALKKRKLLDIWDAKAPSWRRGRLEILLGAKREETRIRRINAIQNELKLAAH